MITKKITEKTLKNETKLVTEDDDSEHITEENSHKVNKVIFKQNHHVRTKSDQTSTLEK